MTWTQEQIDEAAIKTYAIWNPSGRWEVAGPHIQEMYRKQVLAAQMPIAEPTANEVDDFICLAKNYTGSWTECAVFALRMFVSKRNAPPKPDLPTRIETVLTDYYVHSTVRGKMRTIRELRDEILAIVKEQP